MNILKNLIIDKITRMEIKPKELAVRISMNEYGLVICPVCHAIAFSNDQTPPWMTGGYCWRCGQRLDWSNNLEIELLEEE